MLFAHYSSIVQKPLSLKIFLSEPKLAFLAGVGTAIILFFVFFLLFSASFLRMKPEPARMSTGIDRDHPESTGAIEKTKPGDAGKSETIYIIVSGNEDPSDVSQEAVFQKNLGQKATAPSADPNEREPGSSKESEVILQVGSYQEKLIALRLWSRLVEEGHNAYIAKKIFKDGRIFYRVRIHFSQDKVDVSSIQDQLREQGFEKAFVVTR